MEVDVPTFAPHINPISSEIVRRSQPAEGERQPERWEQLYELAEKKKAEMEQRRQQSQQQQELALKEQYPFQPQLVSQDLSGKAKIGPKDAASVETRAMMWKKSREEKLKTLKEVGLNKELEGCTFKPDLKSSLRSHVQTHSGSNQNQSVISGSVANPTSAKSVEKYLAKQKGIRQTRQDTQKKAAQSAGSGNVWTKKLTVPKAPNFRRQPDRDSLKALTKVQFLIYHAAPVARQSWGRIGGGGRDSEASRFIPKE